MNPLLEKAQQLDEYGDNVGSATAYEELLTSGDATAADLVALALVYWEAADSGVAAAKRLSIEFEDFARRRLEEVLGEAIRRDPSSCEAKFWSMYSTFIMYKQPGHEVIDALLDSGDSRCNGSFATMWRIGRGDRDELAAARSVLAQARMQKTSKGRYIDRIISASLESLGPKL
jgi:hypothetical protein